MVKNLNIWLGNYFQQKLGRLFQSKKQSEPVHVMLCFVDHFEPDWKGADFLTQFKRVNEWVKKYPLVASKHKDADGRHPQHTFFYPAEVYNKEHLDRLAGLCKKGFGEVEIHLHHDNDTEEGLRGKLERAKEDFGSHGLLGRHKDKGDVRYGFIHGNWALNNSHPEQRWCGVNNESQILTETGCYADFTLPSAPSATQTKKINSLYYDFGDAEAPKSHDDGVDVEAGKTFPRGLMIVQGPLALNWKRRKGGIFPRIENADVTGTNLPTPDRVDLWMDQKISVKNKPDWVFVKIHTHGAVEKNAAALLGQPMEDMCDYLESKFNDGKNFVLHYVTAREMYNVIKAAEAGEKGAPGKYRDYLIVGSK